MRNIIILGAGESGYGAACLAQNKGYVPFVSDSAMIAPKYKDKLDCRNIDYEQNGHNLNKILSADLIVKSPGIPDTISVLEASRAKGIRIISEIEFAFMFCRSKKICITGSNGKTTTTTLIYEILHQSGKSVCVAGNIGESFAYKLSQNGDNVPDWYVVELSSFQLDGIYDFRAEIALLLNITPDHLDRYDNQLSKYIDSKLKIVNNQTQSDTFIYNTDDPILEATLPSVAVESSRIPFSAEGKFGGAWYDGTYLRYEEFSFVASELRVKGIHNIANVLASIICTIRAGVSYDVITKVLRSFGGVEHRMESVGVIAGIEYINDSKATNIDSVRYALGSMTRPTIWIAGGIDKGNDYSLLNDVVKGRVKALVCLGLDNRALISNFEGLIPTILESGSMKECLDHCRDLAQRGDCILLSPACASFDLFQNYEHRGELFKSLVTQGNQSETRIKS